MINEKSSNIGAGTNPNDPTTSLREAGSSTTSARNVQLEVLFLLCIILGALVLLATLFTYVRSALNGRDTWRRLAALVTYISSIVNGKPIGNNVNRIPPIPIVDNTLLMHKVEKLRDNARAEEQRSVPFIAFFVYIAQIPPAAIVVLGPFAYWYNLLPDFSNAHNSVPVLFDAKVPNFFAFLSVIFYYRTLHTPQVPSLLLVAGSLLLCGSEMSLCSSAFNMLDDAWLLGVTCHYTYIYMFSICVHALFVLAGLAVCSW